MKFISPGIDDQLQTRLTNWHTAIEELDSAQRNFLSLKANERALEASLYKKAEGKTVADREAEVYSSQVWMDFANGLATAEAEFMNKKRMASLRAKAFDACYLTLKIHGEISKKGA